MSTITSHVLDTALGRPAKGLRILLEGLEPSGEWRRLAERVTNEEGRVLDLLPQGGLEARTYRLTFDTGAYFAASAQSGIFPEVSVVFRVQAPLKHFHVPLLLSPFGYSTYRGS